MTERLHTITAFFPLHSLAIVVKPHKPGVPCEAESGTVPQGEPRAEPGAPPQAKHRGLARVEAFDLFQIICWTTTSTGVGTGVKDAAGFAA